ncbi:MAG: hypothetical protein A2079_02240 [Geobacteraceae bacterium GWC2_48_7]|nr:MAG: hypothetical protein A2079_02240 [Geobacteraceae bacterium GWC2_48_7]
MKHLFSLPIRVQLLLITLMIAAPAIAIIMFNGMQQRERAVSEAYSLTRLIAEKVESEQKETASNIEQLLVTLAQLPDVRQQNKSNVQPLLQQLKALNPEYVNILVADLTGKVWAAVTMPPPPSMVSDRRYFTNSVANGRISSGEYVISKSLSKPVFHFAYPYRDQSGKISGAIVVALSLEKYLDFLKSGPFPQGSNILLLDHSGVILNRALEPEKVIGRKYPEKPLQEMFAGPEEFSYRGVGSLNDERFISYRKIRLGGESTPYMYVRVGVPVKSALANANRFMVKNIALLSTILFGTLLLAYLIGKRSIADRISLLQQASKRFAEGELQVRAADSVVGGELGELAQSFDAMAGKLAEREQAIRESEERFKALSEASFGGIIIHDNGLILECNDGLSDITGFSYRELVGMNGLELVAPESLDTVLTNIRVGYDHRYEVTGVRKDGARYPLAIKGKNITYKDHDVRVSEFRDISDVKRAEEERNQLEKQLLQAQKMESLGVLAGGIAHDFNNLLMVIIGNLELAKIRVQKESPAIDNIRDAEAAATRAADLTKQMLAYSGKGKFVIEEIDINHLMDEMLHLLQVSISKKAVLRFNLAQNLPSVEADATQLRQIVMNLVINASEAIGDRSGVIAISTGCMDCDKRYLKDMWLDENITEGLYVYLEIADTGCGMDKETMSKVFDPFFTTKFTGRGLGMAAVLGIIRGHKGAIKIYSEPGKGTTFKILLPASNRPVEIFNGQSQQNNWKGSGTVLLVDDEETVRGIGAEMLKELGFIPLTAHDGRDALAIFRETPDINFVILDLTMPHMDGEQCFRELRQINANVKVIMTSGYNEQEVTQKFVGKGLAGFIQKPYKLSVLRETIRSM